MQHLMVPKRLDNKEECHGEKEEVPEEDDVEEEEECRGIHRKKVQALKRAVKLPISGMRVSVTICTYTEKWRVELPLCTMFGHPPFL